MHGERCCLATLLCSALAIRNLQFFVQYLRAARIKDAASGFATGLMEGKVTLKRDAIILRCGNVVGLVVCVNDQHTASLLLLMCCYCVYKFLVGRIHKGL